VTRTAAWGGPAATSSLHPAIARQASRRYAARELIGLKVNLYTAEEVAGLAQALDGAPADTPVECVMVGDSYFTTHLCRESTRLTGAEEQAMGLSALVKQVAEVRAAMDALLPDARMPYLMADLPDGTLDTPDAALRAAQRFADAGADVVKLEVAEPGVVRCLDRVAGHGIPVAAHLGYTPQRGSARRQGDTVAEAMRLFAAARDARDAGACALVLELVSEVVNRALSLPDVASVPVYSTRSGSAPYGGQSLNVWDAVFRPSTPQRLFPQTATLDVERDLAAYTADTVTAHLGELLRLTLDGEFPLSPPTRLTADEQYSLLASWPWRQAS
jgi:ketopantoate hydroxymethyltransferase